MGHKTSENMNMVDISEQLYQECPDCMGPLVGRNTLIENIAAIVFSKEAALQSNTSSVIWEEE